MTENTKSELGFIHQFIPAANRPDQITLLLLHGTGGNEQDRPSESETDNNIRDSRIRTAHKMSRDI